MPQLIQPATPADAPPAVSDETAEAITNKLEELHAQLKTDLPTLAQRLEELIAQKAEQATLADAPTPDAVQAPAMATTQTAEDTAKLQEKLQEILEAIQASQAVTPPSGVQPVPDATQDGGGNDAEAPPPNPVV